MGESKRRKAIDPNYGTYSDDEKNQIFEKIASAFFDVIDAGTVNNDSFIVFAALANALYQCHELMEKDDPLILDFDKKLVFNGKSGIFALRRAGYSFESEDEDSQKIKLIFADFDVIDLEGALTPGRKDLSWIDLKRLSRLQKINPHNFSSVHPDRRDKHPV